VPNISRTFPWNPPKNNNQCRAKIVKILVLYSVKCTQNGDFICGWTTIIVAKQKTKGHFYFLFQPNRSKNKRNENKKNTASWQCSMEKDCVRFQQEFSFTPKLISWCVKEETSHGRRSLQGEQFKVTFLSFLRKSACCYICTAINPFRAKISKIQSIWKKLIES
jgi:hypothetical protein